MYRGEERWMSSFVSARGWMVVQGSIFWFLVYLWWGMHGPWFCSKGIGICPYLNTKYWGAAAFGRRAKDFFVCGHYSRSLADKSPPTLWVPLSLTHLVCRLSLGQGLVSLFFYSCEPMSGLCQPVDDSLGCGHCSRLVVVKSPFTLSVPVALPHVVCRSSLGLGAVSLPFNCHERCRAQIVSLGGGCCHR